ncbi:MAG TPA: AAA domain-containing protein [Duganella sp.]
MHTSGRKQEAAEAGNNTGGNLACTAGGREHRREAANALNFWQALEYMAPQEPPTLNVAECVWSLPVDAAPEAMPWADADKIRVIDSKKWSHRRYQLFAGIVDGPYLIDAACSALGAPEPDLSERKPPAPAACVVLNVNQEGLIAGEVFVSALPWAMARLIDHQGQPGAIDFSGFFGMNQHEDKVRQAIKDLLFERKLICAEALLDTQLRAPDAYKDTSGLLPVSTADMAAIAALVFRKCGWLPLKQEAFRVQALRAKDPDNKKDNAVVDDPLNSFFAEDLERVADALARGDIGAGLTRYLAGVDGTGRIDLDADSHELIQGVHPALHPRGCWPSEHPLVTAQQFAVNTAMRELSADYGIFAVNGPPGTGKTTMLKDIVAAIVVQRADVLAQFDDPTAAFVGEIKIADSDWPAARLDARLQGFGIVVSSANNGAVENISKEFPSIAALAPGEDIDYFSIVADSAALPKDTKRRDPVSTHWGLLTAVLGSKAKRNLFAQRFWFEGFPKKPEPGEVYEPPHPLRLRSLQELIKKDEHGALKWAEARANYAAATAKVDELTGRAGAALAEAARRADAAAAESHAASELSALRTATPGLVAQADGARLALQVVEQSLHTATERQRLAEVAESAALAAQEAAEQLALLQARRRPAALVEAEAALGRAEKEQADLRIDHDAHARKQPGIFARFFNMKSYQRWETRSAQFDAGLDQARADVSAAYALVQQLRLLDHAIEAAAAGAQRSREDLSHFQAAATDGGVTTDDSAAGLREQCAVMRDVLEDLAAEVATADAALARNTEREAGLAQALAQARASIANADRALAHLGLTPDRLHKWHLSGLSRHDLHSGAPYFTRELFAARSAVFGAAMALHKSFIVAAWRPLHKSLAAFVNVLNGTIHPNQVEGGVGQLWDAFFLVVPVVSTTFASFPRLFTGMRRESLAWLLIDEAGQAAPQQAVGAIWRARRTILVGDPRQLEPVVGVPEELIGPLLERCGAEAQWAPPLTSAQTLADRANRYGMYIGDEDQRIWLGAPLLVHRRCLDPMFSIANDIAYDGKMIYGTAPDKGCEGAEPSRWIDMPASQAQGHWIESQARHALLLVEQITGGKLKNSKGEFKLYIITPFRMVSIKLKELLVERYGDDCDGMSGTVHTFQGKEAEHVVFLLGGDPKRPGVIASFAGKKPNLVNVAVTRAKRRLIAIGDRSHWSGPSDVNMIFQRMADQLKVERALPPPP